MIYSISGKILKKGKGFVAIEAGGVGYKILMPQKQITELPKLGETTTAFCFQKINRDFIELYGFPTSEELEVFELLTGISGIGAKAAVKIIEAVECKKLYDAAEKGKVSIFSEIPGIGKKKASRIMFELQEKLLGKSLSEDKNLMKENSDLEKALQCLGYEKSEIREAIKKIPEEETDLEKKIKIALKYLSKKD